MSWGCVSQRSPAPRAPPAPSQPHCSQGSSTERCAMQRCPEAPPLLPTDGTGTMGRAAPSRCLCWLWTCALGRTGCSPCSGLWGNWCHWLWLSLLPHLLQCRGAEASSLAVPIHAAGTGLLQPRSTPEQVPATLQLPPCPGQFTGTLLPGTFLAQTAQLFAVI